MRMGFLEDKQSDIFLCNFTDEQLQDTNRPCSQLFTLGNKANLLSLLNNRSGHAYSEHMPSLNGF